MIDWLIDWSWFNDNIIQYWISICLLSIIYLDWLVQFLFPRVKPESGLSEMSSPNDISSSNAASPSGQTPSSKALPPSWSAAAVVLSCKTQHWNVASVISHQSSSVISVSQCQCNNINNKIIYNYIINNYEMNVRKTSIIDHLSGIMSMWHVHVCNVT